MDTEKLRQIAGYYLKDKLGIEADTMTLTYSDNGIKEYIFRATAGERQFDVRALPLYDKISLTEIHHEGSFKEAAVLPFL